MIFGNSCELFQVTKQRVNRTNHIQANMNYNDEIDKLEEQFRKDGFKESLTTEELKKLESTFMSMVGDLYQLDKLKQKTTITEEERTSMEDLESRIAEKMQLCKTMSGLA